MNLRLLRGEREEMQALQSVLEGTPQYAGRVTGAPPGAADTQSTYSVLPEGKGYEDKFVYGLYAGDEMVGCADVIRGHGRAAYHALEKEIQAWGAKRVRIGVVRTNEDVLPFWKKLGFAPTGEVKPNRYGPVVSEVLILEKGI